MAPALDNRLNVNQYLHNSWTQEQGTDLPPIHAMVQAPDGYLWLGTSTGIYRFDGVRLTPWDRMSSERLSSSIGFLAATERHGLWISASSGIVRFQSGKLQRYPEADTWLKQVSSMAADRFGNVWILGMSQEPAIARLSPEGVLQVYGRTDGLPPSKLSMVAVDIHNRLWISTSLGVCQWYPGQPANCKLGLKPMILSKGGNPRNLLVWDTTSTSILRFSGSPLEPETLFTNSATVQLIGIEDSDGNTWVGAPDQGLVRANGGKVERFSRRDGLSGDLVTSILEDHEGNLWVGTNRGIDRFRNPKVRHLTTMDALSSDLILAVAAAPDGSVWVGTSNGLNRVSHGKAVRLPDSAGLPSAFVSSLYADSADVVIGTLGGLGYLRNNRFRPIHTSSGSRLPMVQSIVRSPDGDLWGVGQNSRVFTIRDGVAQPLELPELPAKPVYQLFADPSSVWIGYLEGGLSVVDGKSVRNYGAEDGLAGGSVQAIAKDRSGTFWIGTRTGLSRFQNREWTTWGEAQGIPEQGIRSILEDNQGGLWIVTAKGISLLPRSELNDSRPGRPVKLSLNLYGQSYGMRLAAKANMANPRGAQAVDGTLWIATEDGVAIVDPERVQDNHVPPPVVIEEMAVDGNPMDMHAATPVGLRGRMVRITYSGLSLVAPERVRFRYKLEGLDPNWTEAGTVRTAVFGNLAPGQYRFLVTACNNDEVWNETGAVLTFDVKPYFYQTKWFYGLCVAVLAGAGWLAHRGRMRRQARHFQLIAGERSRLTREIHDSLLQGFSAVIFKLEAASKLFEAAPDKSRQRLDQAIDQAEHSLIEARLTIQSMHLPELETSTLPEALTSIAKRLTDSTSVTFALEVGGHVQQLPYDAQAGAYFIGREAITNSVNHAGAKRIWAKLSYQSREVRLTVQDDGCGFDLEKNSVPKPGHLGLAGMRERANKIGASLKIDSSPGQGSVIEVVIPRK